MRFNGGVIGAPNEANTSFASGVWGWDEQFVLRRNLSFPNRIIGYDLRNVDYSALENRLRVAANTSDVFFTPDGLRVFISRQTNTVDQYDLSKAWDIRSAYRSQTYVNTQDSALQSFYFKSDGTKMYLLGNSTDTVFQYSLSTPWDVTTASYDNISFLVSSQDSVPLALAFKSDGTKMYMGGDTTDTIYEYSLPTPWVLTGATLIGSRSFTPVIPSGIRFNTAGDTLYVSNQSSSNPTMVQQFALSTAWSINSATSSGSVSGAYITNQVSGLHLSDDGSQLYITDALDRNLFGLSLSNAWDVTSARYSNSVFSVVTEETLGTGLAFSVDGANVYVVGTSADRVFQYSLSTPWSIGSATYSGLNFSVSAQDSTPAELAFKPDGSKMYILGDAGNDINQYTLSESWNVASASFDSIVFSVATQDTAPSGIAFRPDGSKMYVVGSVGDNVYQYSLSSAWNIASASYDSVFFYVGSRETAPVGVAFRDNGAKMFITGLLGDDVGEYTLSESWNIASAAFSGVIFEPLNTPVITGISALEFSTDGLSLYLLDSTRDAIYQFSLLEANNISGATYLPRAPGISIATLETSPADIALRPDGTRLYFIGLARDNVYQYSLSVPFNLQSATYSNVNLYVNAQETAPHALAFKPDGSKMYLVGTAADRVFQYTLSSPWDLDSASYDSISFSVSSQQTQPLGLAFSEDGTQMYVSGSTPANVHQYVLSSAWDVSSASYSGKTFSVSSEEASPQALAFKPGGKLMYIAGTNDIVYQYSLSTAWDVSTASNSSLRVFYAEALVDSISGLTFSPKGDKLYLIGSGADIIQEIPIL